MLCGCTAALLWPADGVAHTLNWVDVVHADGTYTVAFEVTLPRAPAKVKAVLGDYSMWPRLSAHITESRLLETLPSGMQRVAVTFRVCVLGGLLCRPLQQVKDVDRSPDGSTFV